jgi:AcrR family transcriptional regulator
MPYPNQTSRAAIIAAAYALIERDGAERLTLAQLAEALQIKAPSLYRHVPSKAALIQLVNAHTVDRLFAAYAQAAADASGAPVAQLRMIMRAHRGFAHDHPIAYSLAFTAAVAAERPADAFLARMAEPIQELMAAVSGPERALAALRGALALTHGFAMLEINQQLRRGGDLEDAFTQSIDAYLRGWVGDVGA